MDVTFVTYGHADNIMLEFCSRVDANLSDTHQEVTILRSLKVENIWHNDDVHNDNNDDDVHNDKNDDDANPRMMTMR